MSGKWNRSKKRWLGLNKETERMVGIALGIINFFSIFWGLSSSMWNSWKGKPHDKEDKAIIQIREEIRDLNKVAKDDEGRRAVAETEKNNLEKEKDKLLGENSDYKKELSDFRAEQKLLIENHKEDRIKWEKNIQIIVNESQQRSEIISWHDFPEKEITDKNDLFFDWKNRDDVKEKAKETIIKQQKCKGCDFCNSNI